MSDPHPIVRALYDFKATFDGDLELKEGDEVRVLNQKPEDEEPGWFECQRVRDGATGLAPANYLSTPPVKLSQAEMGLMSLLVDDAPAEPAGGGGGAADAGSGASLEKMLRPRDVLERQRETLAKKIEGTRRMREGMQVMLDAWAARPKLPKAEQQAKEKTIMDMANLETTVTMLERMLQEVEEEMAEWGRREEMARRQTRRFKRQTRAMSVGQLDMNAKEMKRKLKDLRAEREEVLMKLDMCATEEEREPQERKLAMVEESMKELRGLLEIAEAELKPPVEAPPTIAEEPEEEEEMAAAAPRAAKAPASDPEPAAPPPPPASGPPELPRVRALWDWKATSPKELSFSAGAILTVIHATDPHWWLCALDSGETGYVPNNRVESLA